MDWAETNVASTDDMSIPLESASDMLLLDDTIHPTCSPADAFAFHQKASKNYAWLCKIVNKKEMPSLKDIYCDARYGTTKARVDFAPADLQIDQLFLHWDGIAHANFFANYYQDIKIIRIIFFWGIDYVHSFTRSLDHSRYNLILSTFNWARSVMGTVDDIYKPSALFWRTYTDAWFETHVSPHDFTAREKFILLWQASPYDLVLFFNKNAMRRVVRALEERAPPISWDPLRFLDLLRQGQLSQEEFELNGPVLTMHFLLAREKVADELDEAKSELNNIKKNEARHEKDQQALDFYNKKKAENPDFFADDGDGDDEEILGNKVPGFDWDEEDEDVEMGDAGEEKYAVPDGIQLQYLPWNAQWMQALLNLDTSVQKPKDKERPETGKVDWISPQAALEMLKGKVAKLEDVVESLEALTFG